MATYTYSKLNQKSLLLKIQGGYNAKATAAGFTGGLSTAYVNCLDTFSGNYNPKWKDQVKSSLSATTDAIGTRRTVISDTEVAVDLTGVNPGFGYHATAVGNYLYPSSGLLVPPAVDTSLDNVALGRFYNGAYNVLTEVNGGVFLGSFKKLVHDLRHPLSAIEVLFADYLTTTSRIKKIAKSRKWTPRVLSNTLADTWLQLVYGWVPNHIDMSDILDYIVKNAAHVARDEVPVQGKATREETSFIVGNTFAPGGTPVAVVFRSMTVNRYSTWIRGVVRLDLHKQGSLSSVVSQLGLYPPKDFLPSLWQLIPFSFIADYFANIGTIVNAFSVPSSAIRWAVKTQKAETTVTYSGIWAAVSPSIFNPPLSPVHPPQQAFSAKQFVRGAQLSGVTSLPSFQFNDWLSIRHTLSLLALTVSRLTKS